MGWGTGPGTQGLTFNFDLASLGGGDYQLVPNNNPKVFTDLSLYLMGFIPASDVSDHFVFDDKNQPLSAFGTLHGPVTSFNIGNIISAAGPRVPDYTQAQKKFRVATILVSKDGLLSEDAMRLYDYFSARAEETEVVPYSSGLAKGESNPFYLATQGIGQLDTRIKRHTQRCQH